MKRRLNERHDDILPWRFVELISIPLLVIMIMLLIFDNRSRRQVTELEATLKNQADDIVQLKSQLDQAQSLVRWSERYLAENLSPDEAENFRAIFSRPPNPMEVEPPNPILGDLPQDASLRVDKLSKLIRAHGDEMQGLQGNWAQNWEELIKNFKEILSHPSIRFIYDENQLRFDTLSADLRNDGVTQETLEKIKARALQYIDAGYNIIQVEGHADERQIQGSKNYKDNYELSAARALTVARTIDAYLIANGKRRYKDFLVSAAGFGEHLPRDLRSTEAAWARNRRIELVCLWRPIEP